MGLGGRMKEGGVEDNSQVYGLDSRVDGDATDRGEKHRGGGAVLHNCVVL